MASNYDYAEYDRIAHPFWITRLVVCTVFHASGFIRNYLLDMDARGLRYKITIRHR